MAELEATRCVRAQTARPCTGQLARPRLWKFYLRVDPNNRVRDCIVSLISENLAQARERL